MIVLLLLGVCCSVRTGYAEDNYEWDYGETLRMRLNMRTNTIAFTPQYKSHETILWRRNDPPANSRVQVIDDEFVIHNLVQQDSGRYQQRDRRERYLSSTSIVVQTHSRTIELAINDELSFNFDMKQGDCNIKYYSSYNDEEEGMGVEMVHKGRLQTGWEDYTCQGMMFQAPCGILNYAVDKSCSGHFIIRDDHGNRALFLRLYVEEPPLDTKSLIIAVVCVALGTIFCCCLVKRCCCKKKSAQKASSEAAAAPPVFYHGRVQEPVAQRTGQLSRPTVPRYSAQPPYAPTVPLIHNPPTVSEPTPHSEAGAPAEPQPAQADPLYPDHEPRYELKGGIFQSAPPLSAESSFSHVYTSDKLN